MPFCKIGAKHLNSHSTAASSRTYEQSTFVHDGDSNRVKQVITGGNTTLYTNKYYEKLVPYSDTGDLTSGNITSYYYLGGRLVAMKQGSANVTYVHQDHLSGTSVVSDSAGVLVSSISYMPFGLTRSGSVPTDIKFTGQRLDGTGLYYYGARYYDPAIGRFISAIGLMLHRFDFNR